MFLYFGNCPVGVYPRMFLDERTPGLCCCRKVYGDVLPFPGLGSKIYFVAAKGQRFTWGAESLPKRIPVHTSAYENAALSAKQSIGSQRTGQPDNSAGRTGGEYSSPRIARYLVEGRHDCC